MKTGGGQEKCDPGGHHRNIRPVGRRFRATDARGGIERVEAASADRHERPTRGSAGPARRIFAALLCLPVPLISSAAGCTAESVRIALEAQQRADVVQQAVFERQNDALRILLYRDLLRRLAESGVVPDERQRAIVSEVWNDRDLFEFWTVQQERSRALRLIGVDHRLYSEQSIIDLLIKSLTTKIDRIGEHAAARAGAAVRPPAAETVEQGEKR